MKVRFYKMQGCGNDYIYIDCIGNDYDIAKIIPAIAKLSNRNFGIGGDGVVFVTKSQTANCKMQMYNSDGSYSDMCGNALRCIAWLMYVLGYGDKNITIQTNSNIISAEIIAKNQVKIAFSYDASQNLELKNIRAEDKSFDYIQIDLGNPHSVIKCPNVESVDVAKYGSAIAFNKNVFINSTNVEFYEMLDNTILKMKVWERGAGETLACGSGAIASCIAHRLYMQKNHPLEYEKILTKAIKVILKGGELDIELKDNLIMLTGKAILVYTGEIEI